MNSIKELIKWINSADSPIEIMDNESFSLPFIAEYEGHLRVAVFSYSRALHFGGSGEPAYVRSVYYIDSKNPSSIVEKNVGRVDIRNEDLQLYHVMNESLKTQTAADIYHRAVALADDLIAGSGDRRQKALEYAACFNAITGEDLKPYYLLLGTQFFYMINKLI